jgi:hypothetical protein
MTMRATFGYFILWNWAIKWANRLPAALGCAFMTRIPLLFPSSTGFILLERLISRRPAGIEQKNSGDSQIMMTFDLTQDYHSRALWAVGLTVSNGLGFANLGQPSAAH